MKKLFTFLIVFTFIGMGTGFSQFKFRFFEGDLSDGSIGYNFFIGDDADLFKTSINGFGSGFIFDNFTGRASHGIVSLGTPNIFLRLDGGIAINKYRFSNNILLSKDDNQVNVLVDDNPDHMYSNTFFGYGKTKLVYGSLYFPLNLHFKIGNMHFVAGGLVDLYLSGKFKSKYEMNGEKIKEKIPNKDFKNFYLNTTKYGVNAMIYHEPTGIGIGGTYMLTPFFQEGKGPSVNEVRVSLRFGNPVQYKKN